MQKLSKFKSWGLIIILCGALLLLGACGYGDDTGTDVLPDNDTTDNDIDDNGTDDMTDDGTNDEGITDDMTDDGVNDDTTTDNL